MKHVLLLLALVGVVTLPACASRPTPPIIVDQGPSLVSTAVSIGTQAALWQAKSTKAEALQIAGYITEAKLLLSDGTPPASVLDQVAALLNQKITSPYVRAAIQQGILIVKERVKLPVDGVITPEVKVWLYAVLDGGVSGCNLYALTLSSPQKVAVGSPSQISFR